MPFEYRPYDKHDAPVDQKKCRADVHGTGGWHSHQCPRLAIIDGKWCRQHDPKAEQERDAARRAKWKQESDARTRGWWKDRIGHVYADARESGQTHEEAAEAARREYEKGPQP